MKKVLLLYADVGSGHRMAVQALQKAFSKREDANQYEVLTIDLFAELDVAPFNTSNISHELFTSNYTLEALASFIWRLTNTFFGNGMFRAYVEARLREETRKFLIEEKPDLVICAHPIVATAVASVKKELNFKLVMAVTDLVTMMRGWHDENADLIFAPSLDAKETMQKRLGALCPAIESEYFPLRQNYLEVSDANEIRAKLGFAEDRPIIGITGGGVGTKVLAGVIADLASLNKYNLLVFTGNLNLLKQSLERKYSSRQDVKVLGFIDNIYDYFNACDLVIAKPSATTVMELTAMQKPAVFSKYLMENDRGNVNFLLRFPWFRYAGASKAKLLEQVDELMELYAANKDVNSLKPNPDYAKMVDYMIEKSLGLLEYTK